MMSPIGDYLAEFRPYAPPQSLLIEGSSAPTPMDEDLFAADETATFEIEEPLDAEFPDPVEAEPQDPLPDPLEALRNDHALEMAEARQRWVEVEGANLATMIAKGLSDIEDKLADSLTKLLEPLLTKAVRLKAVDQLRDTMGSLLAGGDDGPITVSGPADLVEAIRLSYADQPSVVFQTADEPDVTIKMGDTRIRSQLRAWARKLDAALGAER